MTALPPVGTFQPVSRSNADAGEQLERAMSYLREDLGGNFQDATIADGAITAVTSKIYVDTQGQGSIDDLDRIDGTGREIGNLLMLHSKDAGRDVRVRGSQGGPGQIFLANPANQGPTFVLTDPSMVLFLQRAGGDAWAECGRWFGNQNGAMRAYLGLEAGAVTPIATGLEVRAGIATDRIVTPGTIGAFTTTYDRMFAPNAYQFDVDTDAEVLAGKPGPSGGGMWRVPIRDLLRPAFHKYFESSELSCAASTSGSVNHNLGATPKLIYRHLRCKVAALGFNPGDEVDVNSTSGGNTSHVVQAGGNGSQVFWRIRLLPALLNAAFNDVEIDPVAWRLVIRAWR